MYVNIMDYEYYLNSWKFIIKLYGIQLNVGIKKILFQLYDF